MGKVVLVTGASAGIGKATALELTRAGHIVYGAARRVHKMDDLRDAGGHALALDVRRPEDLERVIGTVIEEQGRIDVLVNNAGTVMHGAAEDIPLDQARDQFEVNVFAPARLTQLALPHMRARGSGTIVNVSSIGGEIALPLGCWYYATKHALEAYSDTLRMEVEPFGIDVVIIQPGIIRTGFEDHTARDLRAVSGTTAYGEMAEAMAVRAEAQLGENSQGSDPGVVAAAIRQAVEAGKPETRYAVGWMADRLLELNRTLPDRDFDRLVTITAT
ncbi:NAD(P)-dependent dehydrogenase (short-subunit alcohol dehydrogenase family) [Nonomuraea thailandensis]|uniref:NAD(P)-dependent dehydrogenase (Short-subunit alcohol dehydrogenase family) n=1 Tax=Nonomuraea thailandensis TaxID=1188745 RepID=A0A9X2K466_9ACTN|nr:oxidoreductase [Nonomuraea thailandensis]MCP2356276.1 NAD(P)-dependent dehydrogenase (short-subunit alcohol dehydrogenase family) [Nonomuraea thailandensis]